MQHEFELIKAIKYSSQKKYAVLFGAGNQRLVLSENVRFFTGYN